MQANTVTNNIPTMFSNDDFSFKWKDIQTTLLRIQYNRMLNIVIKENKTNPYKDKNGLYTPNYLNNSLCLTLADCILQENTTAQVDNVVSVVMRKVENSTNAKIKAEKPNLEALKKTGNLEGLQSVLNTLDGLEPNFASSIQKQVSGLQRFQTLVQNPDLDAYCIDFGFFEEAKDYILKPNFEYRRNISSGASENQILTIKTNIQPVPITAQYNFELSAHGLSNGALLWLYYYERMGIFQILGALMDDYNYKGKYTISGKLKDNNPDQANYNSLMDSICTLYRLGIGSNLRDRIATYQRSLGVTIENNLNLETEKNTGFMHTFNKLITYMLEYYKAKQLADAIGANNGLHARSSVATQTSIRDTLTVLKQQLEPFEYGRNQINTFIGIATVHATISLVRMLKDEIGIPRQYNRPEEFISAAYDILVKKNSNNLNEVNRFIIHDNCASYGYRLLTDIERADLNNFKAVATNSSLDLWLDDVEGWVEGYNNAFLSIKEPVGAMV
jgi:hypothetical protein